MTSGGDLQPNRAKDTKYDIDMKSPATSRYIGQTGGHQARRPKVYLCLDRDPVLVGIVRPPHSARRLCQRIPQIIAPPPHLQRSPAPALCFNIWYPAKPQLTSSCQPGFPTWVPTSLFQLLYLELSIFTQTQCVRAPWYKNSWYTSAINVQ